jgi:site-specific recombinase XerD
MLDIQDFLSDRSFSRNTRETYGLILSRFAKWLGDNPLEAFSDVDFDHYTADRGWARNYRHLQQAAIRSYCRWAFDRDKLVDRPPFLLTKSIGHGISHARRILTIGEIEQVVEFLLSCRNRRSYRRSLAMILLSFDTGLRASEICCLTMMDFDIDTRRIQIRGTQPEVTVYCIGDLTAWAVTKWLQDRANLPDGHPHLFLTSEGLPLNRHSWRLVCRRLGRSSGVPHFSPEAIRRTVAARYQKAGAPTLQAWRGIGGIVALERYLEMFTKDSLKSDGTAPASASSLIASSPLSC